MTDHLLWLDLETTGSDAAKDCIIEVGCVLTTTDLVELGSFDAVVSPTAEGLGRLMLNDFVRKMHETNGLLDVILATSGSADALRADQRARQIIAWAEGLGASQGKLVLAGSGVGHFDRRFIAKWMPELDRYMRYWCVDIGVVRRFWRMAVGFDLSEANNGKTHRALDDARCHLAEAQAFRDHWQATT